MRTTFTFLSLAAVQAIYVNAFAIPYLSSPSLDKRSNEPRQNFVPSEPAYERHRLPRVEQRSPRKHERQNYQSADSAILNLSTVIGVSDSNPASTTDVDDDSTPTSAEGTITVTQTVVVIATATDTGTLVTDSDISTDSSDANPTDTEIPVTTTNSAAFGGQVGQIVQSSAPTGGAIVTIGDDSFGGVVGVINAASDGTDTDSVTTSNGAFGGVVSSVIFPTNLVSTASVVSGFGGVVGLVSASSDSGSVYTYRRRDIFTTSISFPQNASSAVSSATETSNVVVVTATAIVSTTITVSQSDDSSASVSTTDSDATFTDVTATVTQQPTVTVSQVDNSTNISNSTITNDDIVTATAFLTTTLTISTTLPTALPPFSLSDIFPDCQNVTGLSQLSGIVVSDIVLPSQLTLSQVLGFFGGTVDCSDLLTLLLGNSSQGTTSFKVRGRSQFNGKRERFRYMEIP